MATTDPRHGRRPRRAWGIRQRVVFSYLALVVAGLAIALIVTRQSLLSHLAREIDDELVQEVEELRLATDDVDPDTGEPFGTDVEGFLRYFLRRSVPAEHEAFYTLVGGQPFLYNFGAPNLFELEPQLGERWSAATEPTWGTEQTQAGELRYLATPMLDGDRVTAHFVVAYFPEPDREDALWATRVATIAGVVVVLFTGLFAWSIAGRVLRPVRELTRTAHGITETDLSGRIPVVDGDELGELGTTFNEMLDRLEQGFAGQRAFLDDVAHELRTPITIVQGHLELMSDEPDERAETLAIVTDELDRMQRYVDDLLLLAKAENTDFLRPEPVDLGELAHAVLVKVQGLDGRAWKLDRAPSPGAVAVIADPVRLSQAMLNLATNAMQHTAGGDAIAIGIEPTGDTNLPGARLWVRDTGPGIDAALVDRLFDRQVRGAASRAARADGLGIGLSIVAAIARAHGGTVTAANDPAGGARFTITIPPAPPGLDHDPTEETAR